jgi:hypothetical protein
MNGDEEGVDRGYGEGEEIWMTGELGGADERNGWSGAEGMVRRKRRMGRANEVNEERGYTGDWERGMSRGI